MSGENFNTLLQKRDPDRRLAALFASPEQRERLFALYAFNQEIGGIAEATSESLIGEMKLTWWRDAVEDLYLEAPRVRRHAVTEGLAPVTDIIAREDLLDLIAVRFDDVSAVPYADLEALLAYVDRTAGALIRLGLALCDTELDAEWSQAAGRAWGLTGLLRAFAHRAAIGRAPLGGDDLAREGGSPSMLAQGLGADKAIAALGPVRTAAEEAYERFRAKGAIPAPALPVLAYVVLTPRYLKALPDNPFHAAAEPSLIGRQLRLNWAALTGR